MSAYRPPDSYSLEPPVDSARPVLMVKPYVTYALLGLTILVYLAQVGTQLLLGLDLPLVFLAKINEMIRAGEVWRLITPVLLHGSLTHIFFNMYALFSLGTDIEQRTGHWRFLLLYLLTGFTGNVLSFMLTEGVSVGASTAIFGLLAAQGVFVYHNRRLLGPRGRQVLGNIVMIAAVNLFLGLSPGIDNWGHIGGLLGGLIFTWLGGPLWEVRGTAPEQILYDRRTDRAMITAALAVAALFGALALIGILR